MSNNKQTKNQNEGMDQEVTDFMDNFKEFLEINGVDPEKYDDIAFQVIELMALHDSYAQEIMRYKKEQKELQKKTMHEQQQ
ncbi:MAG: hypothetical protein ACQEQF_05930 [Bacillota bacterium]